MPSTSSGWIESKRTRRPPSSTNLFQTRFLSGNTQNNNNSNNNQEQGQDDVKASSPRLASSPRSSPRNSPRPSSSPSITRQSTLVMTKDNTTDTPQLLLSSTTSTFTATAAATTTATTTRKQTKLKPVYPNKSNQKIDSSNAFKMSSMLNRVLDKAATPNTNNNSNNNDNASPAPLRSSRGETKVRGGKQDELPSGDGDSSNNIKKNATAAATTAKSTAASSTTTVTASRSKKNPGAASTVTSIAERLPKGSRAKPLPLKSTTPTTTSPSISTSIYSERQQQPTQTGDKLSQAISLSSSMPSIPSQMEPIDLDEDGDERMSESSPFYLSLATTTEGDNTNHHPVTSTTAKQTQRQQPYTAKKAKEDVDLDDLADRAAGGGVAAPHGIDFKKKQASAISIASSKDEHASIIPSVQVERIANWMGGVKEAMEDNDTLELDSTFRPRHQQTSTSTSTDKNNASSAQEKYVVKADTVEDTPAAGPRKPALRRPPPAPSRHVVTLVDASPPLPPQDQAQSIFEVVPLSLEEEEPLQRNYRSGQMAVVASAPTSTSTAAITTVTANQRSGSKGKRVIVEDSLSSLPPVPLFHEEMSNVSESDAYCRKSGGEPSSSTTPFKTAIVDHNPPLHHQDDLSTIVGGQAPTQDSFVGGPVQSLPSFIYETEEEAEARTGGGGGVEEREHVQNDPSLPSELTASCLQELGLKRKNVRGRSYGAGGKKRHLKSRVGYGIRGSNIDRVLEEGDDEDDEEEGDEEDEEEDGGVGGVALAQRVAFPSSFDLAPMSTLSRSVTPPLSLEVIEGPFATYTPAGRTAAREDKENEHPSGATTRQQQQQQIQRDPPSFPSPPASLVFSTMPSMPTLPTFPSMLYQEPSLIMLDSQTQQTQPMEELTQSQDVEDELDD